MEINSNIKEIVDEVHDDPPLTRQDILSLLDISLRKGEKETGVKRTIVEQGVKVALRP